MYPTANVRTYAPETWAKVDIFSQFYAKTYTDLDPTTTKAVSGARGHWRKAALLRNLAIRLAPNLVEDDTELRSQGYTAAIKSQELAAIVEAIFAELYSAIDCSRKVVYGLYVNKCRGLKDSTRTTFARLRSGQITGFPDDLKEVFLKAGWYTKFREIRDEITHGSVGSCRLDSPNGKIYYQHFGVKQDGESLRVDDIFKEVDDLFEGIGRFVEGIFSFLVSTLNDVRDFQLCGFFYGRAFARLVSPLEVRDWREDGVCQSHIWFDKTTDMRCPLVGECMAYQKAKE